MNACAAQPHCERGWVRDSCRIAAGHVVEDNPVVNKQDSYRIRVQTLTASHGNPLQVQRELIDLVASLHRPTACDEGGLASSDADPNNFRHHAAATGSSSPANDSLRLARTAEVGPDGWRHDPRFVDTCSAASSWRCRIAGNACMAAVGRSSFGGTPVRLARTSLPDAGACTRGVH